MESVPGPFEVRKYSAPADLPPDAPNASESSSLSKEVEGVRGASGDGRSRLLHIVGRERKPYARRSFITVAAGTEVEKDDEADEDGPFRNFECDNYNKCLSLAAALDWNSFTCEGCSCEINQQLIWRARHRLRSEPQLAKVFNLPLLSEGRLPGPADHHK